MKKVRLVHLILRLIIKDRENFDPLLSVKPDQMITGFSKKIGRGRMDFIGPCKMCGVEDNIEIHHVWSLSKRKRKLD